MGNIQECFNELEEISLKYKIHHTGLELQVKMYGKAENWDHVEPIAQTLARLVEDNPIGFYMWGHALRTQKRYKEGLETLTLAYQKFTQEWRICYDLACCLAMLGNKNEARLKLEEAIQCSKHEDIRLTALEEPELGGVWGENNLRQ